MSLLTQIAKDLNAALKSAGVMTSATLTKRTVGTRTPGDLAGGTQPTTATYACKVVVDAYSARRIDGAIIKAGDKRIIVTGQSIASSAVPVANDTITVEGTTYTIIAVERDAASAAYVCQSRGG